VNTIPNSVLTLLAGILLTLISFWYGQNHGLLPTAASEEAAVIDRLFNTMMTISVGLFLLVQGILIYAAIRFRHRKGEEGDGPHVEGNIPLEILWTAIPAVIVFGISVYSFNVYTEMGGLDPMAGMSHHVSSTSGVQVAYAPDETGSDVPSPLLTAADARSLSVKALDPRKSMLLADGIGASPARIGQKADVVVDVMGLQYAWLFTYPESGVTSGELHIPVDREIQLNIQAQDVLHAFWLPEFRLKQDAIPGRTTELRFSANRPGNYPVICAELCGPYHGAMNTRAFVESAEEFDAWLQSQVATNPTSGPTVAIGQNRSDGDRLAPVVTSMGLQPTLDEATLQQMPQPDALPPLLSHHHTDAQETGSLH
jgi:cytochrome c oxidase subunit 2